MRQCEVCTRWYNIECHLALMIIMYISEDLQATKEERFSEMAHEEQV